jgi:hypothetical protein
MSPLQNMLFAHLLGDAHVPSEPQTDCSLFSHFVVFGRQAPTHPPAAQRFGHVASSCQAPLALHVRRFAPSQLF